MDDISQGKTMNFYSDNINIAFAAPVKKNKTKIVKEIDKQKVVGKSKIIAIILVIVLGRFGAHKFYLGKPAIGFLYIIFSRYQFIVFLCACDIIMYLFMKNETWLKEYGYRKLPEKERYAD